MFLFKTIGGYILADDPTLLKESKIIAGAFYTYFAKKPDPIPLYKNAILSIGNSSQKGQFLLTVTRVFKDGELEIELEKTDIVDEERVFLISKDMNFKLESDFSNIYTEPVFIFSWLGLDSRSNIRRYEYIVPSIDVGDDFANAFYETLNGCIQEYKTNGVNETEESINNLSAGLAKTNLNKPSAPLNKAKAPPSREPNEFSRKILDVKGNLLKFSQDQNEYISVAQNVTAWISQEIKSSYNYWIIISSVDVESRVPKTLICQLIDSEINPSLDTNKHSFSWNNRDDNKISSYLFLFADANESFQFSSLFTRVMYETLSRQSYDKVPDKEREYHTEFYNNASHYEALVSDSDDSDDEIKSEGELGSVYNSNQDGKTMNSHLAVGFKHSRSYVVRGSIIDVFKHSSPSSLEFTTAINSISDLKGKNFNPDKVLLHDQDSSMILMNPLDQQTLYRMDLERGKVVEEWKIHDSVPCTSVFGSSKYSQMTPEKTLFGIGPNALYRIDPRINGPNKLVETELKQYLTKQNFSCATTTQKGEIAVASLKGEIKLFDRCGVNAKTALPAMGDQIFSLDVSNDGRYIIATCKTYILLVDVLIQSDPQKRLGFVKAFPKAEKPIPKRLQLRPEDVALINQPVSFTPAHFNSGKDSLEKYIITSTGPYIILWNFRKIKNGNFTSYSLRKCKDNVIADNFQFDQDSSVIVALPNEVAITTKEVFKKTDGYKPKKEPQL